MQILAVASEAYPLIKTGGLADVVGALPSALAAEGMTVRTLLPGYPSVMAALQDIRPVAVGDPFIGDGTRLLAARGGGLDLFVLDAPALFARAGNPYVAADGRDWQDNGQRFAALCRAGAAIARGIFASFVPHLVHAHDWQGGLVPAYLAFGPNRPEPLPPCVFTIHNIAFGGLFPASLLPMIGLPAAAFTAAGVEFYDQVGFLKSGLQFSAHVTTVSPTYAEEIRTPEGGMGYDGVLRARGTSVSGILNGIDTSVWDTATDKLLPTHFDVDHLDGRVSCKVALQEVFHLDRNPAAPLFGVVSRLTTQKGLDLLVEALPALIGGGGQLALIGAGDAELETAFRDAALRFPRQVGVRIGYDEALAHLVQAGSDALLVPSRFEPCGLTQLCALRYGSVPIVARVGGLADTVIDANPMAITAGVATGVQFTPVTTEGLAGAIRRAIGLFAHEEVWTRLRHNGMTADVSWSGAAKHYAELFRRLAPA
jgi:starch synthase